MMRTKDGFPVNKGMWITMPDEKTYEIIMVHELHACAVVNEITWVSDNGDYTCVPAGILTAEEIANAMYD